MKFGTPKRIMAGMLAFAILWVATPGRAEGPPATLAIAGEVQTPLQLSPEQLKALPPTTIDVSFMGHQGTESARYTGVLLWTLLDRAGFPAETGRNPHHLNRTLLAIGHDGYRVAVAVGEIDPEFEGKQVIVAYAKDDKPLADDGAFRLIVPGDHRGGRDVRELERIELK